MRQGGGMGWLWAVLAIAAVGLWYLVLWLLRGRLRKDYIFNIKT